MQHGLSHSVAQIALLECGLSRLTTQRTALQAHIGLLTWKERTHAAETDTLRSLSEAVAAQSEENASLRHSLRESRLAMLDSPGGATEMEPHTVHAAVLQGPSILADARGELEEMGVCVGGLQREVAERTTQVAALRKKEAELSQEVRSGPALVPHIARDPARCVRPAPSIPCPHSIRVTVRHLPPRSFVRIRV